MVMLGQNNLNIVCIVSIFLPMVLSKGLAILKETRKPGHVYIQPDDIVGHIMFDMEFNIHNLNCIRFVNLQSLIA